MSELSFRRYRDGDERAICRLFQKAFGRRLDSREWVWRFRRNPAGRGIIELAWEGATLAGHYAASPVRLRIRGQDVIAGLSGTTMTDSRHRGRGLFPLLARRTYERALDAGMVLVMGFPNKNSHRGLIRDLGWFDVHEVPKLVAGVGDVGAVSGDPGIVELDRFDTGFDQLWDEVRDTCPICLVRNRGYLQWRYAEHPVNRYRIFACEERGTVAGYAVVKRYENELHIVDILCRDADTGVRLVRQVARAASKAGLPAVSTWLNPGLELHRELERLGFQPGATVTYFCVLRLGPTVRPYDYRDWYLTMGDSDVY